VTKPLPICLNKLTNIILQFGVNNLYAAAEDTRDSTKLNDFCVLSKQKGFKTFFFSKCTVADKMYFNLLWKWTVLLIH